MTTTAAVIPTEDEKITCQICGEQVHAIRNHIKKDHEEMIDSSGSLDAAVNEYSSQFPLAPLYSQKAIDALAKHEAALKESENKKQIEKFGDMISLKDMWAVRDTKETRSLSGDPIMIPIAKHSGEYDYLVPEKDKEYVANMRDVKIAQMGFDQNIPTYLWGFAGVGKSTLPEQICARTNRPMLRVQHTGSTEESHILGQMAANETGTYFVPGPLAIAMRYGLTYLADEYDFAFPQVLAVYQPVLEGKPLYIKEADEEWKRVIPHKDFRFVATGNTNGSGDSTGLFQGTNVQNAANYERFGIVHKLQYMSEKHELAIVMKKTSLVREEAQKIIDFGKYCRKAYQESKITNTLGPRVLITIGKLWILRGDGADAAQLAFINRLPESDQLVVNEIASRVWG